ncbi:fluoroquinolone transport system permease protein [Paenibacillus castaneae]|uniref:hypothetical protein n=1 Tax=Paenibacillus castaneae TaxID=474957 RepID=UPI000C9BBF34|nr:hypothetical protein [Paenibacillus castaneae]NIK79278.1 fluoroquinolone transport system permease protein [Paenibacillus castaneae]
MSRKYQSLIFNDVRQIAKDPMLLASLLGPLAIIAFARFGFPFLSIWLEQQFSFYLYTYSDFTVAFLLLIIPLLPGAMSGLLMLDERDENLISYYAATPLTRHGYIFYRLALPCFLSAMLASAFLLLSGIAAMQFENLYTIILLTLEAPCLALFLVAFAANKVEGLALSKISGLLFAGPIAAAFIPDPLQYLALWVPTYWPAKTYLLGTLNEPYFALASFALGLLFHLFLLQRLSSMYLKRTD